ncbi:MAG: endonuclease VIII [Gammaproteobacteria bacterium]|nr:endonuclease VIII [Gammaproteobacteria bacterium]
MPEGPEIRREADRIGEVLVGRRLVEVGFGLPRLRRYASVLTGCVVDAVDCRGKALLTRFDNGLTLYSHNQLYGRWYVRARDDLPRTNRSLRVALHTDTHSALLYSASDIEVLDDAGLAAHPFLARLGPDLLTDGLTGREIADRLRAPAFRRRTVQALYLDQGFVAGVGNYLRSEILFHARIAPDARPADLDAGAIGRLGRSTVVIGERAYRTAGLTNPPSRVAALKRRGLRRADFRFAVFAREGRPCYRCGTRIRRITAASRRLYYCPACQRS